MAEKFYNFYFFYNEEEFCFYLANKTKKFETLFKENNINKDVFEIELGKDIYIFQNPGSIEFIFPDNTKKDIFISNPNHALYILNKFKEHDFFYAKTEKGEHFSQFLLSEFQNIYPVNKIKIVEKDYNQIITSNNRRVQDYEELTPKDLAFSFEKYLEHSNSIQNEQKFFNLTEKRKTFFQLLDSEIKKNILVSIAGPEGIGKTVSILAYCKIKIKFFYFYYNVKVFWKLLVENNNKEIKKLLIEELSHTLNKDDINNIVKTIIKKDNNKNSIDFLIHILEEIENLNILVIDQYKTFYDENYNSLQKLINQFSSKSKIIVLSSMNEDDVKYSIVKGITEPNLSKKNFFLDYIYVGELAEVSKEQSNSLNKEEKEVLDLFGNLYSTYYKLLDYKKNYSTFDKIKFQESITNEIKDNLAIYFKNKPEYEVYFMLLNLIKISLDSFTKETFIEKYNILPFRYIKFRVKGKNIFKISEISNEQDYNFEYLYKIMYMIFFNIQNDIFMKLNKNKNLLENIQKAIQPLNLENSFFLYLLGKKSFDKIVIKKIIKIDSIYSPSDEDFIKLQKEKENLNINDGILIAQISTTAISFDFGILVKTSQWEFKFYLIQVTRKKDAQERITINSLNDYFGFFKGLYKIKSNILISNGYFCYVFEEESKDYNSIDYCKENKLDYLTFSPISFKINNNQKYELQEYFMKKKIIINENYKVNEKEEIKVLINDEIIIEKFFPKISNIQKTYDFLKKKRKLMLNKEWKKIQKIIDEINKKNNYYTNIGKNFKIKIKQSNDYNSQEEAIRKYLLDEEFKDCNLTGIKFLVPNQKELLEILKNQGLSDNEINNFYDLIKIDKKDYFIFNITFYKVFYPYINIPEYMTFILMIPKDKKKKYYLDYDNYKKINLSDKKILDFEDVLMENCNYIAITFVSKNMAKEKIPENINYKMDLEEEIEKKNIFQGEIKGKTDNQKILFSISNKK